MTSGTREVRLVVDASPLIGLAKIGRLGLLEVLAERVVVPRAVWREVVEAGLGRPEAAVIAGAMAGKVEAGDPARVAAFQMIVDAGEAEAIALAMVHPGSLLLIDDSAGRAWAVRQGVRCLGTAGLLLRARRWGLVPSLGAELRRLREHGLFLHPQVMATLLAAAGEG